MELFELIPIIIFAVTSLAIIGGLTILIHEVNRD